MKRNYLKISLAVLLAAIAVLSCSCGAATGGDAPDGMKKIETDIDDYSIYVPQAWTIDLATGVASAYMPDNASISMMTVQLDRDTPDLDSYWTKTEDDFRSTFGESFEYDGENPQNTLLGGVEARKYVYSATVTGSEYKFMQVICMRQSSALLQSFSYVYVFTYAAPADVYGDHLDDVNDILTNFRFNDTKTETEKAES